MAQSCQKHEHLRRGRILGLVQDYHRIVQGSTTHKSQGYDFDHVIYHKPFHLLEFHHVVKGVKKRAKVRIYLGLEVSRQESQPLAGLDGRTGEDDPFGRPPLQKARGDGNG